jgi:phage-related protein
MGTNMVLLHGFQKKTQKTPFAELHARQAAEERSSGMSKHIGSSLESLFDDTGSARNLSFTQ